MRGADGVVIVGPTKFGHELGLNVGRTLDGEHWEYFAWHQHGLDPANLKYADQDELERAVKCIIDMFLTTGLAWFGHEHVSSPR